MLKFVTKQDHENVQSEEIDKIEINKFQKEKDCLTQCKNELTKQEVIALRKVEEQANVAKLEIHNKLSKKINFTKNKKKAAQEEIIEQDKITAQSKLTTTFKLLIEGIDKKIKEIDKQLLGKGDFANVNDAGDIHSVTKIKLDPNNNNSLMKSTVEIKNFHVEELKQVMEAKKLKKRQTKEVEATHESPSPEIQRMVFEQIKPICPLRQESEKEVRFEISSSANESNQQFSTEQQIQSVVLKKFIPTPAGDKKKEEKTELELVFEKLKNKNHRNNTTDSHSVLSGEDPISNISNFKEKEEVSLENANSVISSDQTSYSEDESENKEMTSLDDILKFCEEVQAEFATKNTTKKNFIEEKPISNSDRTKAESPSQLQQGINAFFANQKSQPIIGAIPEFLPTFKS